MRRVLFVGVMVLAAAAAVPAFAESCSPAMCTSMSPACWDAYQKAVTAKDKIGSPEKCRDFAADLDGKGSFMKVPDLTERAALCACEAVFWSLGGDAQGLPDIEDHTQEGSNSADDDE